MAFFSKILGGAAAEPIKAVGEQIGNAASSLMDRFGFTKKLTEGERIDKYAEIFKISEESSDSARQMFMTELNTQKQPWFIRMLNGLVRPVGGLGALATEFYAIWGSNIEQWCGVKHIPVQISTEQHLVLAAIIAFYFGSRLKETISGMATKR